MGHLRGLSRGLLLGYLFLTLFIFDSNANKCTTGCRGLHADSSYKEGSTYTYEFEGKTVTYVSEAQGEATLKLSATVELSVNPDCVRQVKLKNVQINGSPVSDPDLEKYALQFNYHHGHIDTEVCAEAGDSQASLNIKRAVISLFQSAILNESGSKTHHETDVFGVCPTDFSFSKDGDVLTVRKQKNLAHCSHRENIQPGLISATYDPSSNIQSSPLLASQQYIEQKFKNGVLDKASSKESYRFRPFSNDDAGAWTTVQSSLTYKGVKGNAANAGVSLPKSLIFDAPHPVTKSSVDAVSNALKAVSAEEIGGLKPKAAEKFAELIKVLRVSSKNDILSVYHKVQAGADFDKVRDKTILLHALYRCGSGEAAEVAAELIKNKEIQGVQALLYYASLIFVHHVNLPSIAAVTSLLDQPDLPRVGYLGIGQVIGKYCEAHPCEEAKEVKEAIQKIREKVGNGKAKSREQENKVISALKALGNTRFLDDATIQKLVAIAADKNVKNRVRVAAIESLPTKCSMKWKNPLFKVLGDLEEDSEIRIKSYLSLVSCACPHVSAAVKEVLSKEKINQVGSFITSHLRNLKSSTDPTKAEAQKHLSGILLKINRFPEDFRKYSFNNEFSYNIEGLGIGSSTESNVIYSQNSFVPRSVSLNLTTEVFGRAYNFLELNGRVENLDRVIEHYLGPKGVLTSEDPEVVAKDGISTLKGTAEYIKQRAEKYARGRRDVKPADLDKFAKNVHLPNDELDELLDVDLSVKLFGVEVAYLSYQGDHSKLTPKQIVNKVFDNIDQSFHKAKNFDYNLQNHLHFLDAELVYPTGLGLSLSLAVTGTSVVHLKTNGKINVDEILKDPKNGAAKVALEPSASIKVAGSVIVHGFDVQSGVKVGVTAHTATATDLSVKILNGKGVDVNFGIPKKKQEIIDVSSEILLSSGPKGDKYVAPKFGKGKEHSDCFDQFSSLLGVTICGQLKYPYEDFSSLQKKPLFPLSGPSKFAITVENNDVTSYHFKAQVVAEDNPLKRKFEVVLETPNSKTNRHVSFLAEVGSEPDRHAKIALDSPIKKASAEAVLKTNDKEKTFSLIVHNDQIEYFAKIGVVAEGSKYKPILEYKVPEHIEQLTGGKTGGGNGQQYNVEGTVDVVDQPTGKKVTFNKVNLIANGRPVVGIDGNVGTGHDQVFADVKLSYGPENLALKLDAKRIGERNFATSLSAVPSKDPNIAFNLKWDYKDSPTTVDSKLVFVHGPDLKSEVNKLTVEHHAVTVADPKALEIVRKVKVTYPAQGFVLDVDGKLTKNSVDGDVEVKYGDFKIGTELSVAINKQKPGDYEVEFEAEVFDNKLEFEAKRAILGPHKSNFKNKLELTPGGKYSADAVVTHDIKTNNVNVQVDADVNLNGQKLKADTALEVNPQKLHSKVLVSLDSTPYVDFKLDAQRGKAPSGNVALNLKNYLKATGDFKYASGKGDAQLNIDIPKLNRKIKAKSDIHVVGGKHNANLEILFDAEKDPSKRIKLSTVTDFVNNPELKSVDTKNHLEVLSYTTELNGKASLKGKSIHEGVVFANFELTLPNGKYITYNVNRNSAITDGKINAKIDTELAIHEKKGGPAKKLTHFGEAKDFNTKIHSFDVRTNVRFTNTDNKYVELGVHVKHLGNKNTKREIGGGLKLSGDYTPSYDLHFDSKHEKDTLQLEGSTSVGKDAAAKFKGTFVDGNEVDVPIKVNGFIDFEKIPFEKLTNLRFDFQETLLVNHDASKIEYSEDKTITYNGDKKIKIDGSLKHYGGVHPQHKCEGSYDLKVVTENGPISLKSSYKHDATGEEKTVSAELSLNNNGKITSLVGETSYTSDLDNLKLKGKVVTPLEKLKNVDVEFKHKREKEGTHFTTEFVIVADGKKYTFWREVQKDQQITSYHAIFNTPKGKSEVISKLQELGEQDYSGEYSLTSPHGYVKSDFRLNLLNFDEFLVIFNIDSDLLKLTKVHAEIANRPQKIGTSKSGRNIVITVTNNGKNLITGSTSYKKKDEDGKIVVEGNGSVKIGENTRSSSFKYTRQQLTRDVDGENGIAILLNANFGPSAVVGELKFTNKEIHVFNSYCEQNKDCAHFKIQAIQETDNKSYYKSEKIIELDLKKFNVPVEFGLKSNTEYKDFKLDHTASLYLHSSKDKSQYTYQLYVHPKEAASILTLPTREVAVIATYEAPRTKKTGAYRFDVSYYLDRKNKPSEKSGVSLTGDFNIEKGSASINSDLKFTYPQQPKDLTVSGKLHYSGEHLLDASLDIDLFAKKNQKISAIAKLQRVQIPNGYNLTNVIEVNSKGQQLKIDLKNHLALASDEFGLGSLLSYQDSNQKLKTVGGLLSANLKQVNLVVFAPGKELVRAEATLDISKSVQKINGELAILNNKPIVLNVESHDVKDSKFTLYQKDTPNDKLTGSSKLIFGQIAEVQADSYKGGAKQPLFHALVKLDEDNFLKPDFTYEKENIVKVTGSVRDRLVQLLKQLKEVSNKVSDDVKDDLKELLEHLKKAQPNLKPLLEYYQNERKNIEKELEADKTVKEIEAKLKKVFGGVVAAITEALKTLTEKLDVLQKQYQELVDKVTDALKTVYPQLKESYNKIYNAGVNVFDSVLKLAGVYLKAVLDCINEHKQNIKELVQVASELVQDVAKILLKGANQLKKDVDQFTDVLVKEVKALPIYELIKEKYAEAKNLQIPEAVVSSLEDLCKTIAPILPTEELRQLFVSSYEYFLKIVKHEKVDDGKEIKKIYANFIAAVQSVANLVQSQVTLDNVVKLIDARIPTDLGLLLELTGVKSLKVSLVNLLLNSELPRPQDIYYTYRPPLNPLDIIPPFSKAGYVIDGGHIFTFDGRHFSLSGSCDYILAQDFENGNFSVVANFNGNNLISVTVSELNKESITIKNNGNLQVNGKSKEFPASTRSLHAYLVKPLINIRSDYGVHVKCTDKAPFLCTVTVSGFYLGKIRGLLGDGNNEPYDDFTLPSGKVAASETEFVNAYKVKADCPAVVSSEHQEIPRQAVCTEYFSGTSSPMSPCFNYVNPEHYRDACDALVASGNIKGGCALAFAYFGSCKRRRIEITVPIACTTCEVSGKHIEVGDSFSVKIPKKEADIIIVVEQATENEKIVNEFIVPLITDLRNELKQQGITDVFVGLIGYGEEMDWPQHYTSGGSTNIQGDTPIKNMVFEKRDSIISSQEAKEGGVYKKLEYIGQRLDVELGTMSLADAYVEAVNYKFRPGAAKAVVGVAASPCEKSPFPISFQHLRILLGQKIYKDLGLTYYHVYFPGDLNVNGKPQKNIVGYDQNNAYTFADSKKKPLEGSSETKNNLVPENKDVCADFAVASGGAAFTSNNFLEAKANQKKQFATVAARKISERLVDVEIEQDCTCTQQKGIISRPVCKISSRKVKSESN